jgi:hypothetical protein
MVRVVSLVNAAERMLAVSAPAWDRGVRAKGLA